MNVAKEKLAYELTRLVHGKEKADKVLADVHATFSGDDANMPIVEIPSTVNEVAEALMIVAKLKSKSEAKRLIEGGGVSIDGFVVKDPFGKLTDAQKSNGFILKKGKKNIYKVQLQWWSHIHLLMVNFVMSMK